MALSYQRKKMVFFVLILTVAFRVCLTLFPLAKLLKFVSKTSSSTPNKSVLTDIIWAVNSVGKRLPFATCLVNGLVANFLCSRNNISSTLHIGVKKDQEAQLAAHAWLTVDGDIVVGKVGDLDTYVALPNLMDES